jgi:hypothetical protein
MYRVFLGILVLAVPQAAAKADCNDELKGILKRLMTSGPFHVDGTLSANAHDSLLSADMRPPRAMHTRMTADGKTIETIKIGPKVWTNDGTAWRQRPQANGALTSKMAPNLVEVAPDYMQGAECLGEQSVDGTFYRAYRFKLDMQGGLIAAEGMLYVDPKTNLLARQVIEGDLFGIKNHIEKRFTFDPSIKIKPPPEPRGRAE